MDKNNINLFELSYDDINAMKNVTWRIQSRKWRVKSLLAAT